MGNKGIIIFIVLLLIGVGIYFYSTQEKCVGEFESMAVGLSPDLPQKECCNGLVPKAPQGFTGGAWCVKSYYEVVCKRVNNVEGIYVKYAKTPEIVKFLKEQVCE